MIVFEDRVISFLKKISNGKFVSLYFVISRNPFVFFCKNLFLKCYIVTCHLC